MRILLACCLFSLSFRTASAVEFDRTVVPAPGPAKTYTAPSVTTDKLTSGLRLALAEVPRFMIVTVKIVFPLAGSARDPRDKIGLAAIATAMLSEGTRTRPGLDFPEAVGNAGASISVTAGEDATVVTVVSNVETLGDAFALAADMLREPQFAFPIDTLAAQAPHNPEKRLAALKSNAIDGLRQAARSPQGQVERNLFQMVFGDHPYARVPNEASVNGITLADIKKFHAERMKPYAIAAAGDIDMETLKREAQTHFGSFSLADLKKIPAGLSDIPTITAQALTTPADADGWRQSPEKWSIRLVDIKKSRRAEVMVGLSMVPRNHPDYVRMQVMRYMFGAGSLGRLNQRLRVKEGWAYYGQGYMETFKHGGMLVAYSNVQPDKAGAAILAIGEELAGMINGPQMPADGDCAEVPSSEICRKWKAWQEEMARQKEFVAGHLLRGQGDYDSLAGSIADSIVKGLPEDTVIQYVNEMRAVTLPQVIETARRYLRREKLHVAVAGDAFSPVHDTQGNLLPDAPTIYQQLSAVAPVRVFDVAGNDITATAKPKSSS